MILLNDFKRMDQHIHTELMKTCDRVFSSGWYILGKEVDDFEKRLATYTHNSWSVGCANGEDAIEIGLRAGGLRQGDKVLTTPLSAFATSLAIHRAGGIPIFADVDACGLLDLDAAEQILKNDPTIHYIVPVHLFGIAMNLERLKYLVKKYHLFVVEDCAQAIGASYKSTSVGTVGQLSAISFYPTKNLGAFGDGGAVCGENYTFERRAKIIRDYGQSKKYIHSEIGLNSRLDELQAALLCTQLDHLDTYIQKRKDIAEIYLKSITNPNIRLIQPSVDVHPVWHLFPILVKERRSEFIDYCKNHGIQTGIHYPILIPHQIAAKKFSKSYSLPPLSHASYFAKHEVSLPIHPYLLIEEVKQVVQVINAWK